MATDSNETGEAQGAPGNPAPPTVPTPSIGVWARIKEHKIAQWTLAYGAAAYALLDGTRIVSDAFDWPHQVLRIVTVLLILGLPLVITLSWFHGHRALHRVSGRELTIITVLLVLAGGVLWRFARAPEVVSEHLATVAPAKGSIAVLPLANESGDPSQQYFSDGLSENLITALTQFPGLKVIGRTSAFQFRDSKEDARSIGQKLGVARLLEGSVQRSESTVRVSAELVDTADGSTQWSERYDRPYKDLFALQDDITRAVAGALRAKLLPGDHVAAQSERPPGGSLEAYNALLQGQFYYFRQTETDMRKAIESYTQATRLDPRYALAWSGLSRAWVEFGGDYSAGQSARKAFAHAREAADRALALAPDLAAAYIARGYVLQYADFDWRGAGADYRRALALAPNDGEAKYYVGRQPFSGIRVS